MHAAHLAPFFLALTTVALHSQCPLNWQTNAGFNDWVSTLLALPDGSIVAGGRFTSVGGVPANRIARFVGGSWQALGSGMNNEVLALLQLPNGDLLAGGWFSVAGGAPAAGLARWNGSTWSVFGGVAGGSAVIPSVNVLRRTAGGDVVIGGSFDSIGGVAANNIARWNGSGFSAFGLGLVGYPSIAPGSVDALAELPNGDLVAGGRFPEVGGAFVLGGNVARWNGSFWVPLPGLPGVQTLELVVRPNGDLLANGSPGTALHRWTGSTWTALPASPIGSVWAMQNLPDGDLLVGGLFAGTNLVRWNGTTWSNLGTPNWTVQALASTPSGDVLAGGLFTMIGGTASPFFGRASSSCPATTTAAGAGCIGSGGAMVLAATSLPWLGGVARARATGLPSASLALGVRGFALGSAPLTLPNAGPGCLLFASPDLLDLYLPVGGAVDTALAIPDSATLIGATVHEQMVAIRLDALGSVVESVSSNALSLTVGDF